MRTAGDPESIEIVRSALAGPKALAALALLLHAFDMVARIVTEEKRSLEQLSCLQVPRSDLVMAIRVATGVGPFPIDDNSGIVDEMLRASERGCSGAIDAIFREAAEAIERLLDSQ